MRRQVVVRLASERTVPLAVALVVLVAGGLTLGPSMVRPVGAANTATQPVRLAIGGGLPAAPPVGAQSAQAADRSELGVASTTSGFAIDDGTLYKPVAVDTSIPGAADLLRYYTYRSKDTLTAVASKFHVSKATIWWANHLSTKNQPHAGQVLVIPPVDGLVITVQAGETLAGLAAKYKISSDSILTTNQLSDSNLILGQVLIMPGAKGAPLPTVTKTTAKTSGHSVSGTFRYVGGSWHWPVVGGGNYISQGFWSGHPGVDIAAHCGTEIVAARPGLVIFAGWQNNGGGYQVWISIGSGMYIAMYHMSAVKTHTGAVVARGQEVGLVGETGWATGCHVHFEIWIGYPWKSASYRVNPLHYI
ncbi:MAG TPA: M23 family metallopeptidase [Candidatus Limnocylindrales bacterium]|nr:M23 family metallopeptidase [Candidatus Limnocylindrales bacterium]